MDTTSMMPSEEALRELVADIDRLGINKDEEDAQPAPIAQQLSDDESSDASSQFPPSPMFEELVDFFDKFEQTMCTTFPVEAWRDKLSHANDTTNLDLAFQAILSLIRHIDRNWGHSFLSTPTKMLAEGSRHEPWRLHYGSSGLLDFYLDSWNEYIKGDDFDFDILRIIANTCVDFEINRERVTAKVDLSVLVEALCIEQRASIAAHALYSICRNYGPAQEAARSNKLLTQIIKMFGHTDYSFNPDLLGPVCLLLDFAIEHYDVYDIPHDAVQLIDQTSKLRKLEFDEVVAMWNTILTLLHHERFQRILIYDDGVDLLTTLLLDTYRLDCVDIRYNDIGDLPDLDEDQVRTISEVRSGVASLLWDLSARDDFIDKHPSDSQLVQTLISWLSKPEPLLQISAISALRVMASDETRAINLLQELQRRSQVQPLLDLLKQPGHTQSTHEALRLLKNLAIPAVNRLFLRQVPSIFGILVSLTKVPSFELIIDAVKVTKILITDSYPGVLELLHGKPYDAIETEPSLTNLVFVYQNYRDLRVRMEIATLVVETLKVAYNKAGDELPNSTIGTIIEQVQRAGHNVASLMSDMIIDSGNDSLKTKGWFGLALLAGSPTAVDQVRNCLRDRAVYNTLRARFMTEGLRREDESNIKIVREWLISHYTSILDYETVGWFADLFVLNGPIYPEYSEGHGKVNGGVNGGGDGGDNGGGNAGGNAGEDTTETEGENPSRTVKEEDV